MANIPTVAWDETSPAGSQAVSLGDDRLREMKTQLREVIAVDHKMASSSNDADNGKHNKVSLLEQADLGTGANTKPILGAQTVSSKPELVYTNEDDVDIQITTGTKLNTAALDTTLANFAAFMNLIYPVGSIYINAGVATNPGTLLGVGTWVAYGAGKCIFGLDAGGDTDFDSLADTGGAKTVTLDITQIPAHTHSISGHNDTTDDGTPTLTGDSTAWTKQTGSAGGGLSHNNMPPYVVAYLWKRTV